MSSITEIEKIYNSISTEQLIQLAKEANTLREEFKPVLKKELESRGETVVFEEKISNPYNDLSLKEIQELVTARLQTGESIESIKLDLTDHGIDIQELFNVESEKREKAFNMITSSKELMLEESELHQKLQTEFQYDEAEIFELKKEVSSRGKVYIVLGLIISLFAGTFVIVGLNVEGVRLRSGFMVLGLGIALLVKGIQQSRK